jgi:hypothetical protein
MSADAGPAPSPAGEQVYRQHGWGPQLTFPVVRAGDRPPLVFQLRLPDGVRLIDVRKLAAAARGAPAIVGRAADALDRAGEVAGVIVAAAICPKPKPDMPLEVLATVTVALSDVEGPPRVEQYLVPESERVEQEVTKMSDRVTRIRRLSAESIGPGHDPVPMLMIQYLIETQFGALAMAFSTTHVEMFGASARLLYQRIFETGFIGENPRPS